jgi:hypothetical protein
MLGIYNTIYKPHHVHDPKTVLENAFSLEEISRLFTVRQQNGKFEVYPNYDSFFSALDKLPEKDRQYHEVIFEQRQKIKFDIDATLGLLLEFQPKPDLDEVEPKTAEEKFWHLISIIADVISTAFFVSYGEEPGRIVVCTANGPVDGIMKYSAHLILCDVCVSNSAQAQEFTKRVCDYLPASYRKFIDAGVNKKVQNFRIVGCHKGDGRVKKIHSVLYDGDADGPMMGVVANNGKNIPREATLITHTFDLRTMPDLVVGEVVKRFSTKMCTEDINSVLDICAKNGITRDNRFNCVRGGMFLFNRIRSSHCDLCNRNHDHDNTVIVNVQYAPSPINDSESVVTVFKGCRRYKQEKGGAGVRIGEFCSATAGDGVKQKDPVPAAELAERIIAGYVEREIDYSVSHLDELYPNRSLFDDLPVVARTVYDEPALRPFEIARTLVVHAAMKMGKTKALRQYVDTYFSSRMRRDVIRYVSFRQTFSGNIKEKFADFTLYSDVAGALSQDRLIIQVESMHRVEIGIEPPDLLILDECESIFEQFDSGLLRQFGESFAKFEYLLKYSKHVVCMDAYISDRTYRILQEIRGLDDIRYHHCVRKNAREDNYYLTGSKGKWFGLLYQSLDDGEKVAVQISSLAEARAVEAGIKRKYPDKTVKLYSSETLASEKKEHFANVNLYWQNCDVLLYTPTVSAGVSFEVQHFDRCYGYFTDQSCPVETCMQMIGRIRDVSSRTYYIYLHASGAILPTDVDAIRDTLYHRRENLAKTFDETGLRVEYGADGAVRYHAGPYFRIWLENTRIRNMSRNAFVRRFTYTASIAGAKMHHMTDEWFEEQCGISEDEAADITKVHRELKGELTEKICDEIAAARDIDDDEAETIRANMKAQVDVPTQAVREYEKYRLRADYYYAGPIDRNFVRTYRDARVRRVFRNQIRIRSDPDPQKAILRIQEEELAVYKHVMDGENSATDVHRKYVFDQHRYAIGLLQLCGWKNIDDPKFMHAVMLAEKLRQGERLYWDVIDAACREFGIRPPSRIEARVNRENDVQYIAIMTAPASKILNIMYGIRVGAKTTDPDMYRLLRRDYFTTSETVVGKPLLRLPQFVGAGE